MLKRKRGISEKGLEELYVQVVTYFGVLADDLGGAWDARGGRRDVIAAAAVLLRVFALREMDAEL